MKSAGLIITKRLPNIMNKTAVKMKDMEIKVISSFVLIVSSMTFEFLFIDHQTLNR